MLYATTPTYLRRAVLSIAGACAFALSTAAFAPAMADVQVGVQIGIPAPPPVFISPPQFVVVPAIPAVQYGPGPSANVFLYGGQYYTWYDGSWFVTANAGQPWVFVQPVDVPRPVLRVPARYYHVPPGQAKKLYRGGGRGHNKHHHPHHDDD